MCLITKQKEPIILKEDLIVYKVVITFGRHIYSLLQYFKYNYGQLYSCEISKCQDNGGLFPDSISHNKYAFYIKSYGSMGGMLFEDDICVYQKGFHFYKSIDRLLAITSGGYNLIIVECTIPKDSEVYFDETGLGVANNIIINKSIEGTLT